MSDDDDDYDPDFDITTIAENSDTAKLRRGFQHTTRCGARTQGLYYEEPVTEPKESII